MSDNYFDHDADIGIIGRGKTLDDCFIDAARVMFSLMGNLSQVQLKKTFHFTFEESDIEFAFVTWLNLLLTQSNANNFIFSKFNISHHENQWHGETSGEPWCKDMERGTDVKGATLTMLSVKKQMIIGKHDASWMCERKCIWICPVSSNLMNSDGQRMIRHIPLYFMVIEN